jgi:putative hydrolase of the HAD superfamily
VRLSDHPNIIFDLGGVILNLNYQKTIDAFKSLGLKDFEESYTQLNQTTLFDDFERGQISDVEFRKGLGAAFDTEIPDSELDAAWNAMLLDLPFERLNFLDDLKEKHRIVLLSNTNEIHVRSFEEQMKRVHGIPNLEQYFEKVFYSCRVGMRKPEPRIFQMVVGEMGFKPAETLFIDDSPQHIEGAKSIGLNTYHLRPEKGETILDLI